MTLNTTMQRLQDLYKLNDIETNSNELIQKLTNDIIQEKNSLIIKKHLGN